MWNRSLRFLKQAVPQWALRSLIVSLLVTGAVGIARAGPVRTSSPGTVVFHGGEFVLRWNSLAERAGALDTWKHFLMLSSSFSPTSNTLFEVEVPVGRVLVEGHGSQGAVGNVVVWGKYRFFRSVETWGDQQAALRVGVELPTASRLSGLPASIAPWQQAQLQLGAGRWNTHLSANFSGARGRWVYGTDAEHVFRHGRDGVKIGDESRWNLDLEHIVFPRDYQKAGGEVFLLFETSLVHRRAARWQGLRIDGTGGSGFSLFPGIQYVPGRRWVVEASFEIPVWKDFGSNDLDRRGGLVIGLHWLY